MGQIKNLKKSQFLTFDPNKMKFLSAFLAATLAEETQWNGYIRVDPREAGLETREISYCGKAIATEFDMRNSTCTISYAYDTYNVYAGNGAFIDSNGDLTGFHQTSGNVQLVVQYLHDDGFDGAFPADIVSPDLENFWQYPQRDNSSCWGDIVVNCMPNADGNGSSETMFMETINADNGANTYNFQISNYGLEGSQLTVMINDRFGNGIPLSFVNTTQGEVFPGVDNGELVFNIIDDAPFLFQFSAYADYTPDLFMSEVYTA